MAIEDLEKLLTDGWEIAGYAVNMLAAGALTHHVLLRNGIQLKTITIVRNGDKELGRTMAILSPAAALPAKKGFFS